TRHPQDTPGPLIRVTDFDPTRRGSKSVTRTPSHPRPAARGGRRALGAGTGGGEEATLAAGEFEAGLLFDATEAVVDAAAVERERRGGALDVAAAVEEGRQRFAQGRLVAHQLGARGRGG